METGRSVSYFSQCELLWCMTPPESHKVVHCSPIGWHKIARMLNQVMGLGKSLLVPYREQKQFPTRWLRGRWPRGALISRRGDRDVGRLAVGGTTRGARLGVNRTFAWDKWSWGIYVRTRWLVSIYPLVLLVIPGNIEIDSNHWCSPGVRMPMPLTDKVVNHLNMLSCEMMLLILQHVWIYMLYFHAIYFIYLAGYNDMVARAAVKSCSCIRRSSSCQIMLVDN